MSIAHKNIIITPNKGKIELPTIELIGSGNNPIILEILDNNTISFKDSNGNLLSLSPSSEETIFLLGDSSNPFIEVDADGEIRLAKTSGNIAVGKATADYKLDINGDVKADSFIGSLTGNANTAATLLNIREISLDGDVTGSVSFDGSSDVSINVSINDLAKSLILTESYTVTSVTRNLEQEITSAEIVYSNGIAGTISNIVEDEDQIDSAEFSYGDNSFELTFTYDESGNLATSSIVEI